MKYLLYIVILVGLMCILPGCDGKEQPFIISNNLPQPVNLQIIEQGAGGPGLTLGLAQKSQPQYKPTMRLASEETASIYTEGVVGGRTGYIVVIDDENGNELFRRTFPRDDLIKHKFELTITGGGIEYSS